MGQGQSQPLQNRASTPEPEMDPEERARMQAEMRERQRAAAEQRAASQQKKKTGGAAGGNSQGTASSSRKPSALEQMSKENKGWRDADAQAELRAWN